jgi:hypothetical protein
MKNFFIFVTIICDSKSEKFTFNDVVSAAKTTKICQRDSLDARPMIVFYIFTVIKSNRGASC